MKLKKIRGHKRIRKQIQSWINYASVFNVYELKKRKRDYLKISIGPWRSLLLTNSKYPEPKKQTRTEIIAGLEKVYIAWEQELKKLNEPYYLKIWIFEPRFSKSQIVCAIGDKIEGYESLFGQLRSDSEVPNFNYKLVQNFNWKKYYDYEYFEENFQDINFVLKGNIWVGGM